MKILAINGSPNSQGVTRALLKQILEAAGQEDALIDLKDYAILPCRGCLGCITTNECVMTDDWSKIAAQLQEADLLIIGFPTYYGAAFGINSLTHNFLERWFSLRHTGVKMNAKKVVVVAASGEGHGDFGVQSLKTFLEAYHGISLADSLTAGGVTPCYVCGEGENCVLSCVKMRHGEEVKITPELISSLEKQPEIIEKAIEIGRKIKEGII